MNSIKRFVTNLLKGFFNDEDKKELIEVMTTSIEEKVDDLVEQGLTEEEAIETSLSELGTTEDVLQAFPEAEKLKENVVKKRKNQVFFATASYLIIAGLAIYINLTYVPSVVWFWFVVIGVLFWPLTMLYLYLEARR